MLLAELSLRPLVKLPGALFFMMLIVELPLLYEVTFVLSPLIRFVEIHFALSLHISEVLSAKQILIPIIHEIISSAKLLSGFASPSWHPACYPVPLMFVPFDFREAPYHLLSNSSLPQATLCFSRYPFQSYSTSMLRPPTRP